MRLGAYSPQDLAPLADFWVAAWTATGLAIDFEARRPWLERHIASLLSAGVDIIVASDEAGAPIGFVTIDRASGYLDQLCVARQAQGRGVARALLDEAKRRAPARVELHVNADNARARDFYARAGFAAVGEAVSALSGLPTLRMEWRA
jgi:putative acetyltransferase